MKRGFALRSIPERRQAFPSAPAKHGAIFPSHPVDERHRGPDRAPGDRDPLGDPIRGTPRRASTTAPVGRRRVGRGEPARRPVQTLARIRVRPRAAENEVQSDASRVVPTCRLCEDKPVTTTKPLQAAGIFYALARSGVSGRARAIAWPPRRSSMPSVWASIQPGSPSATSTRPRVACPLNPKATISCWTGRLRRGGNDLGGEQTQGPGHERMNAASKANPGLKSLSEILSSADPVRIWGKPMSCSSDKEGVTPFEETYQVKTW